LTLGKKEKYEEIVRMLKSAGAKRVLVQLTGKNHADPRTSAKTFTNVIGSLNVELYS
jgi:hypothetical protein